MSGRVKPKPYKLGPYKLSGGQLVGDAWNEFALAKLPSRNDFGDGIVTGIVIKCEGTVGTLANDPAISAYRLQRLLDWQLTGAQANDVWVDRKGWHDAVREYVQFGKFARETCADITATGAGGPGSYARTWVKRMSFVEPFAANPFERCLPSKFIAKGMLRFLPHISAQLIGGASPKLDDLTLTVYVYILDVPSNAIPIGARVLERSVAVPVVPEPSPGPGKFLRVLAALDPATATYADDLSSIDTIDFGEPQGGYTAYRRDVDEAIASWCEKNARDPKPFESTPVARQEYFRFGDPLANASAKLHFLPLVAPDRGDGVVRAPAWMSAPSLRINNDDTTGVPANITLLIDEVAPRTDKFVQDVMESLRPGLSGRFSSQALMARAGGYGGAPDARYVPLLVDAS